MIKQVKIRIGESDLVLETGRMAKQANGAVYAYYEGSAVLATACCGNSPVTGLDYVPLQVEYNEKYYAAGKIPGGFLKREGRPKDKEILVCRLIDRPMRPLFTKAFGREIQVVPTVVSSDQINPPDMIAMVAASAAVVISDIPFDGPVGSVRIAQVDGKLIINPTFEQIKNSSLEIIVSGTKEGITMVEGGADEVSEETMLEAIHMAEEIINEICDAQIELAKAVGKEKLPIIESEIVLDKSDAIRSYAYPKMEEACFVKGKFTRHDAIKSVKNETFEKFKEDIPEDQEKLFYALFESMEYEIVRKSIIEKGIRTDG
ncbi:MAG: polyribonucleotide nucleotidyltransferase, partial [Spirochaetales bacterium]|nr:polyribonucleotide nucleotidyltransferase [Spirochaetales bacterium]